MVILIIQKGENLLYEALHEMKERQDVVVLTMGQSSVRFQKTRQDYKSGLSIQRTVEVNDIQFGGYIYPPFSNR